MLCFKNEKENCDIIKNTTSHCILKMIRIFRPRYPLFVVLDAAI